MKLNNDEYMQIGEIAGLLDITTRTIRLYEQLNLIDAPERTEGGIRVYTKDDIKRLKFVLKLKELGLSLKEMQELAELYKEYKEPDKIMPRLIELLDYHLGNIRKKVVKLNSLDREITGYRQKILDLYKLA